MASRKRRQARARKAKKSDDRPSAGTLKPSTINLSLEGECRHGSPPCVEESHDFVRFYDAFYEEWNEDLIGTNGFLRAATISTMKTYATFPEIWSDDKTRETVRLYFISHAVNVLLESDAKINVTIAGAMAAVVQTLGSYDPESQSVQDFFLLKNRDAFHGCRRSLVRFVVKETPCACLNEMYAEVRAAGPKTGICHTCRERKSRCELMYCSLCEGQQYFERVPGKRLSQTQDRVSQAQGEVVADE